MQKYTIVDIAKMAGVSPSAVSIVLNGRKGVSPETRKRIQDIVDRLKYVPNPSSRRLLFHKTDNIAVLINEDQSPLEHFFHAELNQIIFKECKKRNYNLIYTSASTRNRNVTLPRVILSHDVDGVIAYGDSDPRFAHTIHDLRIPFVLIDNHVRTPETMSVRNDYAYAARMAVEHLIRLGHRKIAYLGAGEKKEFGLQTFRGYHEILEEHNLPIQAGWIRQEADTEELAYQAAARTLQSSERPTAIFCNADIYAIQTIRCLKDRGLHVPEDISVIGIDDILLGQYIDPPLSTIRIDKQKMVANALRMLSDKIENAVDSEDLLCRDLQLVERRSTRSIGNDRS